MSIIGSDVPSPSAIPWHIADELVPKLKDRGYRGRFIVPLPEPRLIE